MAGTTTSMADTEGTVPAVFFKNKDLTAPRSVNGVDICEAVATIIGRSKLVCCQLIGDLWRLYLKDSESRIKLLANSLSIKGQTVPLYNENPYRAGKTGPDHKVVKITVRGMPHSMSDDTLKDYLQNKGLTLTKDITLGRYRDPETKKLLEWYNGERIVYANEFDPPLPRTAQIGPARVQIYHQGQDVNKLCTNCFQRDHFRSQCQGPSACKACRKPGHKAGDEGCEALLKNPNPKLRTVAGGEDPLSNFYQKDFNVFGVKVHSAEQGYQYSKAIRRGDADTAKVILEAKTPAAAKRASRLLQPDPNWVKQKDEVMQIVLEAKAKGVKEFADTLRESGDSTLVESVNGEIYWGSGFNTDLTIKTKQKYWLGQNKLGKMLEHLRSALRKERKKKKKDKDEEKSGSDSE